MDTRLTVSVSLQNKTTYGPEKAYQGSFFVFVNDNENSLLLGEKATLHSNVIISGKFKLKFHSFNYMFPNCFQFSAYRNMKKIHKKRS